VHYSTGKIAAWDYVVTLHSENFLYRGDSHKAHVIKNVT